VHGSEGTNSLINNNTDQYKITGAIVSGTSGKLIFKIVLQKHHKISSKPVSGRLSSLSLG
jgi:hypothetical protein